MTSFMEVLSGALPTNAILTGDVAAPYLTDWMGELKGEALAVLRPSTAQEVSRIVTICRDAGVVIVPQGGNTGLVGAATPVTKRAAVVVQLGRMNRIRRVDARDNAATVEAGCVLATLQAAAEAEDRLFPLSLGSEGSAQIGGLIATNAGGTMALRWGMMRDLVLGLEVVLPDGRIWSDLSSLRKRNLGIDPKHLFIGAEGTTGIVTAAVLKLVPRPAARATAWLALSRLEAGPEFLSLALQHAGGAVDACELIPRQGLSFASAHVDSAQSPLDPTPDWAVLMEISGPDAERLQETLMSLLEVAMDRDLVCDGVVAASEGQRRYLWFLREAIVEGQRLAGFQIKHDIAVPVAEVPEFIRVASDRVSKLDAHVLVSAFGHLGDGNIHFNLSPSASADPADLSKCVYGTCLEFGGTISAEHGLGRKKKKIAKDLQAVQTCPFEIESLLDPQRILNPLSES
ncbi:FAD-binding oxidoreductase [Aliiruegeria sabulilitoris]|uniref:FAD-binding oxidoreductase n=1 Tax=Aliiruegeria sabulilitoris TaxID=1510458 RepID=UPI0008349F3C|nr:FAD-binding oxidoreductase [Aliiruegeria sabulilitoris]NDR56709.1 FAD-binding oxidoreductase [Pseudoruegeria sp. M32A2M]